MARRGGKQLIQSEPDDRGITVTVPVRIIPNGKQLWEDGNDAELRARAWRAHKAWSEGHQPNLRAKDEGRVVTSTKPRPEKR